MLRGLKIVQYVFKLIMELSERCNLINVSKMSSLINRVFMRSISDERLIAILSMAKPSDVYLIYAE